jgi:hypothetical protein
VSFSVPSLTPLGSAELAGTAVLVVSVMPPISCTNMPKVVSSMVQTPSGVTPRALETASAPAGGSSEAMSPPKGWEPKPWSSICICEGMTTIAPVPLVLPVVEPPRWVTISASPTESPLESSSWNRIIDLVAATWALCAEPPPSHV